MLTKNKFLIFLTTLICLLPMVAGILLWDRLPEQIPSHWGVDGQIDGWSSKGFAVFFFPALLAGLHLLCIFASHLDPKGNNYPPQMVQLVLWICPVLSLILNGIVYAFAMGYDLMNVPVILCILVGIMFIVVGNYLPKCRQSYTMGIKLPWTLNDEANWNATHRFGGWVWVFCGVAMLATAFLGIFWILVGVMLVAVLAPTIYSYVYYRKHKEG